MRVLITGAVSLLGKALSESTPKDLSLILTHLSHQKINHPIHQTATLDITKPSSVNRTFNRYKPNFTIHLASESNVDFCESNPARALMVNVQGTQNVLNAAELCNSKVLFTSSNGVFDGRRAPYNERQKPKPIHTYGNTKLQAEKLVKSSLSPWIITRLSAMYGWHPKGTRRNPVTWTIEKLKKGKQLHMVNDTYVNPLYAPYAAEAIWKLIKKNKTGTFHIAGKTKVDRYTWSKKIAKTFGLDNSLISPVPSSFFPNLTSRPTDTSLDTTKIQTTVDWKPLSLKKGLAVMKAFTKRY